MPPTPTNQLRGLFASLLVGAICASCSTPDPLDAIAFKDNVTANSPSPEDLGEFEFVGTDGKTVKLQSLLKKQSLVVVFTQGWYGSVCPYCSTHVSRLITSYKQFQDRGADVVVVYPLLGEQDRDKVDTFLKVTLERAHAAGKDLPFPILLDIDLKAVDALGLRKNLSKPSVFILDAKGRVQFAYVGQSLADRPSVVALLEQVDRIAGKKSP